MSIMTKGWREVTAKLEGNDYTAVNKTTGALGRYQFLPSMAKAMTERLGETYDDKLFLETPELQDKALDEYYKHFKELGGDETNLDQYLLFHVSGKLKRDDIPSDWAKEYADRYVTQGKQYFSESFGLDTTNSNVDKLYSALSKEFDVTGEFEYKLKNDESFRDRALTAAIDKGLITGRYKDIKYAIEKELDIKQPKTFGERFKEWNKQQYELQELKVKQAETFAAAPKNVTGALFDIVKESKGPVDEYWDAYSGLVYDILVNAPASNNPLETIAAASSTLSEKTAQIRGGLPATSQREFNTLKTSEGFAQAISMVFMSAMDVFYMAPTIGAGIVEGMKAWSNEFDKADKIASGEGVPVEGDVSSPVLSKLASHLPRWSMKGLGAAYGGIYGAATVIAQKYAMPLNAAYNIIHGSGLTRGVNELIGGKEFADDVMYDAQWNIMSNPALFYYGAKASVAMGKSALPKPFGIDLKSSSHIPMSEARMREMGLTQSTSLEPPAVVELVKAFDAYQKIPKKSVSFKTYWGRKVGRTVESYAKKHYKLSKEQFEALDGASKESIKLEWQKLNALQPGETIPLIKNMQDFTQAAELSTYPYYLIKTKDGKGRITSVPGEIKTPPSASVVNPKYQRFINKATVSYRQTSRVTVNNDYNKYLAKNHFDDIKQMMLGKKDLTAAELNSMHPDLIFIGLVKDVFKQSELQKYKVDPVNMRTPIFMSKTQMINLNGTPVGGSNYFAERSNLPTALHYAIILSPSRTADTVLHELLHSTYIEPRNIASSGVIMHNKNTYIPPSKAEKVVDSESVGRIQEKVLEHTAKQTTPRLPDVDSIIKLKDGTTGKVTGVLYEVGKGSRSKVKMKVSGKNIEVSVKDVDGFKVLTDAPNPNQLNLFPDPPPNVQSKWNTPPISKEPPAPPISPIHPIDNHLPSMDETAFVFSKLRQGRKAAKAKRAEPSDIHGKFIRNWVSTYAGATKKLKEVGGDMPSRYRDLTLGTGAYINFVYKDFQRRVFHNFDREIGKTIKKMRQDIKKNPKGYPDLELLRKLGNTPRELMDNFIALRRIAAMADYLPKDRHLPIVGKNHKIAYGALKELQNRYPDFYNKAMELSDLYHNSLREATLDVLLRESLISKREYDDLVSKGFYSPVDYVDIIDPIVGHRMEGRKKVDIRDSGLKSLSERGSAGLIDTDTNVLAFEAISRVQNRVFKNRANRSLHDLANDNPENGVVIPGKFSAKSGKQPSSPKYLKPPRGYEELHCIENGVKRTFYAEKSFYNDWIRTDAAMSYELSKWTNFLLGTKVLKASATGYNPYFALRNLPRDMAYIWLTTDVYNPFLPFGLGQMTYHMAKVAPEAFGFHPYDGIKHYINTKDARTALWKMTSRYKSYADYLHEGGGMELLSRQGAFKQGKHPVINTIFDGLGYLNETSEIWSRLALRSAAISKYKDPIIATHIARTYLDFGQGGTKANLVEHVVPYFNASVQATRGMFRAAKSNPAKFSAKMAQLMAISSGLYLANRKNPECLINVHPDIATNNWIITTPLNYVSEDGDRKYIYFAIAKDQGQRAFSAIAEGLTAFVVGDEFEWNRAVKGALQAVPYIPASGLAPTIKAVIGYTANYDLWRHQNIYPDKGIPMFMEARKSTPPAYVKIGEALGVPARPEEEDSIEDIMREHPYAANMFSPERMRYLVSQYFTESNPYVQLVNGKLANLLGMLPEEERDEASRKIAEPLLKSGVARETSMRHRYYEKKGELSKIETGTRFDIDNQFYDYVKKIKEAESQAAAEEARVQMSQFMLRQDALEVSRLVNRYKNWEILNSFNLGEADLRFWLGCADIGLDKTRAAMVASKIIELEYMEKNAADEETKQIAKEESRKLDLIRGKLPAFNTKKFNLELYNILKDEIANRQRLIYPSSR